MPFFAASLISSGRPSFPRTTTCLSAGKNFRLAVIVSNLLLWAAKISKFYKLTNESGISTT